MTTDDADVSTRSSKAATRRSFLAGAASGIVGASAVGGAVWALRSSTDGAGMSDQANRGGAVLLRGGTVLTMDPDVGDFEIADVLVENGTIRQVGTNLAVDGDVEVIDCAHSIVIPGFVNSHIHTFQTALRGYWADALAPEYFSQSREGENAIFHRYTPEDVYLGEYAGALEALASGITTIVDTSQCSYTPEHTDRAVRGLQDSGIRAVYAYSSISGDIPKPDGYAYPQDLRRLAREMAGDADGQTRRVTLALGSGIDADNWTLAREVGVPIFTHVNNAESGAQLEELGRLGLMGPDNTYIHCNSLVGSTWQAIAATKGKVSLSNLVEQTLQSGLPGLQPAIDHGILPSFSTDAVTLGPTDFFAQMKTAYALQRSRIQERKAAGETQLPRVVSTREILRMATVGGAQAAHLESQIGTLTPGKQADIVVLDAEMLNAAPVNSATGAVVTLMDTSNVRTVLVAGSILKRDGELVGVDLKQTFERLRHSADGLFARSEYPRPVLGSCCSN